MVEVYDIETLRMCFTYTGKDVKTGKIVKFVISKWRNNYGALITHLKTLKGQIGFNNIAFDYPVIHYILTQLPEDADGDEMCTLIYEKAQQIINVSDDFKFSVQIPEWKMLIAQLDLYKLCHFDNKAKRTSLKDLEFWMNYPNVQDMPIHHDAEIKEEDEDMILDYNLNDVEATLKFYELCKERIELRKQLGVQYGLRLINANDPKIGSDIILDILSKEMGIEKKELRQMRTHRANIALGEIIDTQINFRTKEFNKLLDTFKSLVITSTNGSFENKVIFKGFRYDYGLGGIHGCIKPGVYQAEKGWVIVDADVASLYPSIAIKRKLYPEHLGPIFVKVYTDILHQRLKAKKEGNKAVNEGLKLALNGAYGKSSDVNSFLYDPKFTMAITVNGQLYLTMLAEMLVNNIQDCTVLQVNTDGITIKIREEALKLYNDICSAWEAQTDLTLEYAYYSKMVIQDVNNYMAIKTDGKVKYKGSFEIEKEAYKDTSFKIVQIALSDYFTKGTPVADTIRNHKNIYDFCGRQKFKSDSFGEIRYIVEDHNGFREEVQRQQKTTRYYIAKKGASFIKIFKETGKETFINKGYQVAIFNKYVEVPIDRYGINYSFYEKECRKILESVENKQTQLF